MRIVVGYGAGRLLWEAIRNARRRIVAVVPYIHGTVIDALCTLAARGVEVKIVTDTNTDPQTIDALKRCGIVVGYLPDLHAKIYIVDDTIYLGSINLTDSGLHHNFELLIALHPEDQNHRELEEIVEKILEIAARET